MALFLFQSCGFEKQDSLFTRDQQTSSQKEHWYQEDMPSYFTNDNSPMIYNINQLPTSGRSKIQAWSAHYWPHKYAGIYYRWQSPRSYGHDIMEREDIQALTQKKINRLSAAEKFDLYLGNYHMPLSQHEKAKRDGFNRAWVGICNGWSLASIYEPEPGLEVTVTNPYGMKITFYRDDIKALLSLAYTDVSDNNIKMVGKRCNRKSSLWFGTDENGRLKDKYRSCRDSNPGTYHLMVTNIVGRHGKTFIIDRDATKQVWNQPVSSYSYTMGPITRLTSESYRAEYRAPGTVYLVDVNMILTYVTEHRGGSIQPRPQLTKELKSKYSLELDANYNIIGGEWHEKTRHPDFSWLMTRNVKPHSRLVPYDKIKGILNASLGIENSNNGTSNNPSVFTWD